MQRRGTSSLHSQLMIVRDILIPSLYMQHSFSIVLTRFSVAAPSMNLSGKTGKSRDSKFLPARL